MKIVVLPGIYLGGDYTPAHVLRDVVKVEYRFIHTPFSWK